MTLAADFPLRSSSVICRLDPRWRIAGLLTWSTTASIVVRMPASIVALIGSILLFMMSGLTAAWLLRRLLGLLPFVVLLVIPLVLLHGMPGTWAALLLIVKTFAIALPIFVVVGTTTTTEICDLLFAIRIPRGLISLFLLSERAGILLAAEFNRLRRAMCIRGFRWQANRRTYATVAAAVGATTIRGVDQSNRFCQALACRGFGGDYRTWRQYKTTDSDLCFVVLSVVAGVVLTMWDRWSGS